MKSRKHIVKYTTTHIAVFITAPQLYNFSVTQISSGVMARAVLLQIITDAQAGQANFIRNLPELLLPAVLQLPDCRDLESNTERRSAQFLGKPEKMRTDLFIRDRFKRITQ